MAAVIDWLNGSLKSIKHELFKDVVTVSGEVEPMGDGQVVIVSDIKRVNLMLETSKGEKRKLKAVAKVELTSGAGKELVDMSNAFYTETMMYGDVLKTMESIMESVGDKEFLWPECYHLSDRKFLFQDLCDSGYSIVPTNKFLDLDYSLIVMKGLGKFHALSMIMKERAVLDLTRIKPYYFELRVPFLLNMHKMTFSRLTQAMDSFWGPEWSSVSEKLARYVDTTGDILANSVEQTKGTWDVLCHGDFSIRNMLFHYQPGSTRPDGVKFVDFQTCHYNNLAFDLASLLYSSLLPQLREENMDKLLATYTDSLAATCKQHGYKGAVPKVTDVVESLKSLSYLTTITSFMSIPFFMASERGDAQEKADEAVKNFSKKDSVDPGINNNELAFFYNEEKVKDALQYEVKRCIKQNII